MHIVNVDVVVIGAGPAGVCAAITAARQGAKTVLVGNRPVLGGNSSSEIRVWTRGATGGGNLFAEEMGVWGDLKLRNLYVNLDGNPVLWDDVLFDLCTRENNLTLLFNLHVTQVEMCDGKIIEAVGWQLNSEREYRLRGKVFVDCTGDGTICDKAGIPFRTGKEARGCYNESFAPEQEENTTQGHSILYNVKKTDHKVKYIPPAYAYDMDTVAGLIDRGDRVVKEDFGGSDYWWFEYGGGLNTIDDAQEIGLELRKLVMGVWNYIKNSGRFDADYYTLEWVGGYSGKRESRRMIADHVLTQNDIIDRRSFSDGVLYGGWHIDLHPPGGFNSETDGCEQIPVQVYEIPLSSLYSSTVPNLLFAGRIIGASNVAFASSRIMNTCALSGQAAGTAAAWCAEHNLGVNALDEKASGQIRRTLLRDDMLIPNFTNDDPADLARSAAVTASSWFDGSCGHTAGKMPVVENSFIIFPMLHKDNVRLLVSADTATVLSGQYFCADIPSRYKPGKPLNSICIELPAGESQWITLPQSEGAKGFVTLLMKSNPHIMIHTESRQRTGLLCGDAHSPEYLYPCVQAAYDTLYAPANLTNGLHRPWERPNLWIAGDETAPWLRLDWEQEQWVGEVRLYLNPDFSQEIPSSRTEKWAESHRFAARNGMPPELLRAFRIETCSDGNWRVIAEENNNWRRMAVISLSEPVKAKSLRVVCLENWGNAPAQMFEVRVYRQKNWR